MRSGRRAATVITVIAVATLTLAAQSGEPSFEAASVKRVLDPQLHGILVEPGGHVTAYGATVSSLIARAFGNIPVADLPVWAGDETFEVHAVAPAGAGTLGMPQALAMMRTLLRTRFALRAHTEMREQPIYVLSRARGDRALGPGLRLSTSDCRDFVVGIGGEMNIRDGCSISLENTPGQANRFRLKGRSMDKLAADLRFVTDRPVRNDTGLDGLFDVTIEFTLGATPDMPDAISLFTAVREQLGLRLEPGRGPVETLVVDAVERPTPD